jgi:predicted HD phosphohydrolase
MDQSTREDWMTIGRATLALQPTVADRVLAMLQSFADLDAGFGVSQLHHALQTATMARRANASDEMVLCALCHDVGKYVSIANHPAIAAEILRPYVSEPAYRVVLTHQDFQGRHYYEHFGKDPTLRERHRGQPWYALAEQFTDEWDQAAFDPNYKVLPLEEFQPLVQQFFGTFRM